MKKLRMLAVTLATALLGLALTATPASAAKPQPGTFTLNAVVLDGGEQIVSLTIDTNGVPIQASSLTAGTFAVHAVGTNPYTQLDPATVFGTFDVDRTVTGVHLDDAGRIVIDLAYGFGVAGASTFAWANGESRNIMLDLTYTVTQLAPITLVNGKTLTFTTLKQGRVSDPEVDAYGSASSNGLKYRLFTPAKSAKGDRPLIVWLHGGGEGGWSGAYNNDLPLIANRGALGFSTPEAQQIFGGAYVLAPQSTTMWLYDAQYGYSAALKALIDDVVAHNRIDTSRIYVVGASNGGYMTLKLVADSPDYFAAAVPTCPAVVFQGQQMISDAQFALMRDTPTWIVQATSDPVLPFPVNGQYAYDAIGNALLSAYPDVTWDGVTYNGHWSWIYVARNYPSTTGGLHLWQWMAMQQA